MAYAANIYPSMIKRRGGATVRTVNTDKGIRFVLKDILNACNSGFTIIGNYEVIRQRYNIDCDRATVPVINARNRYVNALVIDRESALCVANGECNDEDIREWLVQDVIMAGDFQASGNPREMMVPSIDDELDIKMVQKPDIIDPDAPKPALAKPELATTTIIKPQPRIIETPKPAAGSAILSRIDAMLVELLELKHSLRDVAVI